MSSWSESIRSFVGVLRERTASARRKGNTSEAPSRAGRDTDAGSRSGEFATVEVDPGSIGSVRMTYVPSTDGDPDPGEIVWTWVPYEEQDGRGKDRPVLIVAQERSGTRLAVQLTSQVPSDLTGYVAIGSGPWDPQRRPSWADVTRIFRVHPDGSRREAAAVDKSSYVRVAATLRDRYLWR